MLFMARTLLALSSPMLGATDLAIGMRGSMIMKSYRFRRALLVRTEIQVGRVADCCEGVSHPERVRGLCLKAMGS